MTLCALAVDAGADGCANVLRPLCGLLLDVTKPRVHAAPSATASSAVACRGRFEGMFSSAFWVFMRFRALAVVLIYLVAI